MSTTLTAKAVADRIGIRIDDSATVRITVEESRQLRAELERAEEEAGRKSAYQKWAETDGGGADLFDAWNAAIEAAISRMGGCSDAVIDYVRTLKEPVE